MTQNELATHANTIGVANTQIQDGQEVRQFRAATKDRAKSGSNYSYWIDLCANGDSALSLQADPTAAGRQCDGEVPDTGVFRHGGTSAAASMLSGAAALVLTINPDLNWKQVRSILCASAEKIDCGNPDPDGRWQWRGSSPQTQPLPSPCSSLPPGLDWFSDWYGYGRLNVYEAVRLAHVTTAALPPCEGTLL
jgi:hypothetical protein